MYILSMQDDVTLISIDILVVSRCCRSAPQSCRACSSPPLDLLVGPMSWDGETAKARQRFHSARASLRAYFVCEEELWRRIGNLLQSNDSCCVAIERCLSVGIATRPDGSFPCHISRTDVSGLSANCCDPNAARTAHIAYPEEL